MSDTIIRVENLSKKYTIAHQQEGFSTLRDLLTHKAKAISNKIIKPFGNIKTDLNREDFWALKDVSFEIKRGDRVGIIGRNGAGKSTLLKILSRITEPTCGRISIKGRVASLLEVGTGFHPELTGRENIYLNGAILGMSKVEIKKKFDEIVAFAEVEKFLDTPVKRYSSGMYVRLAFAVAAHLEPEILIVDEVLAVGDAAFQKKCLGKMEDVGKEGRTVLFVSHNMATITQLCQKAIYLRHGQIADLGNINAVVANYLTANVASNGKKNLIEYKCNTTITKKVFFTEVAIYNLDGDLASEIDVRQSFYLNLKYEIKTSIPNLELSVRIDTYEGIPVFTTNQSDYSPETIRNWCVGKYEVSVEFPNMFLMPGTYLITIGAHQPLVEVYDIHEHVMRFTIAETGTKLSKYKQLNQLGFVIANFPWLEEQYVDVN